MRWKSVWSVTWPLVTGLLGFILTWGAWHLIQDHNKLHQIWNLELQRAAAVQAIPGGQE